MITEEMRKYLSGNPYVFEGEFVELSDENKGELFKLQDDYFSEELVLSEDMYKYISGNPYRIV
ncbi:hypothetical protein [Bacillus sp. 165]|uniref:hypothetical protein n=1 Tax=Bacillus sp. 165 TaxID=1529117 RepID=UPI001ADC594F|nr:hypothetical protein [Bacillus sp. 165]MBO9129691.1 hypothetical protein [Bacillus sp. 165]